MLITSRSNPQVKQVRKLAQLKARRETDCFFVGGPHLVLEALAAEASVEQLLLCPELVETLEPEIRHRIAAAAADHTTLYLNRDVFATVSDRRDQFFGCAAVIHQRWTKLLDIVPQMGQVWLACHAIQYPANLGTMMRTLDAVGGTGLLLLGDSTDPYDPAAVRASQGSVFRHTLVQTNTAELAQWQQRHSLFFVGTSPQAHHDYRSVSYPRPCVVFMGNERSGLGPSEMELCQQLVSIPMLGQCDSLNVAVAAGLILYEAHYRQ